MRHTYQKEIFQIPKKIHVSWLYMVVCMSWSDAGTVWALALLLIVTLDDTPRFRYAKSPVWIVKNCGRFPILPMLENRRKGGWIMADRHRCIQSSQETSHDWFLAVFQVYNCRRAIVICLKTYTSSICLSICLAVFPVRSIFCNCI